MKKYLLSLVVLLSVFGLLSSVSYAEDDQSSHVHEMGEWTVVVQPTCGEDGYKSRTCMTCTYSESEIIPATGDHILKWEKVKSTCMNAGYEDGHCINCDYEIFIDLELAEHTMGEWTVIPSTCGKEGYKSRTCMECGYSESEIIPATGDHILKWETVESTCINAGYENGYCINCDYEIDIDLLPTDEHTYGAWKAVSKATAYMEGKDVRSCKYCGHKEYRSTPKLKKKISKDEQNVKKTTDTFFKYLKKYDIGKMKKCFATPKKVKFFSSKKYLSKYIRKHNKSISYQLRDIKVTGKTATVTVSCKYYDAYFSIFDSLCDVSQYRSKKKRSKTAIDKYQYNRLLYYDQYFNDYENKVITIKLKKVGKNWKMSNPSSDLYNVMHCNYTKAYNTFN